jgi:hypothetical protein
VVCACCYLRPNSLMRLLPYKRLQRMADTLQDISVMCVEPSDFLEVDSGEFLYDR